MNRPKILLIDDEEELVITLVERLQFRGIQADAVTNGHDAIEKLHHTKYDVVVADLKMPGLSGEEVIGIINQRFPEMKIILITGHGNDIRDESKNVIGNVFEILMKPFNINQLIDSINNAIKPKQES